MAHTPSHVPHTHDAPDAWHTHTAAEGLPQQEHASVINSRILAGVLFALVAFVVVSVGVMIIYFNVFKTQFKAARQETDVLARGYVEMRAKNTANMAGVGWADMTQGRVRIPVDQAIDRVVEQYQQRGSGAGSGAGAAAGASR
jgi:hypothetical protein